MRLWVSGHLSCARGSTMPDGHSVPDVLRQHRTRAEALLRVPSTLHRTLCKRCAMHSHKIGTFFMAPYLCVAVWLRGCVLWLCVCLCVCVRMCRGAESYTPAQLRVQLPTQSSCRCSSKHPWNHREKGVCHAATLFQRGLACAHG